MATPMLTVGRSWVVGGQQGLRDRCPDALGQVQRLVGAVELLADHDELVAAVPRDGVGRT
ncbi:MAG: hypothetical protein M3P93_02105 [Actinomycetota bacterium]|nr:hypothetical protein [Actinomycetota bacterium]